jgi:mono/diheme cytochrome c family protein
MHRSTSLHTFGALALTLGALGAGCGGGDGGTTAQTQGGGAAQTQTQGGGAAQTQTQGGGAAPTADGRALFEQNCGTCHTLQAAGTSGGVGPNLDQLRPDQRQVLNAIRTGPGPMPSNLVQGADATAVAQFVSQNAGR